MPRKKPSAPTASVSESDIDKLANQGDFKEVTPKKKKESMKNVPVGFAPSFLEDLDSFLENSMPGISRNAFIRMAAIEKLNGLTKQD